MRNSNIKALLFLSILVIRVLPMLAAVYFLNRALQTRLDLGFTPQIVQELENSARNLKTLRRVDPQNEAQYREQFHRIDELRQVYANPELVKSRISVVGVDTA
jgi:hypothetical protein